MKCLEIRYCDRDLTICEPEYTDIEIHNDYLCVFKNARLIGLYPLRNVQFAQEYTMIDIKD